MSSRERLISSREQAGLSRQVLGKAVGVSRVQIYRVEMDLRDPSPTLMRRWAKALGENVADIWPDRDIARVRQRVKEGNGLLAEAGRAA